MLQHSPSSHTASLTPLSPALSEPQISSTFPPLPPLPLFPKRSLPSLLCLPPCPATRSIPCPSPWSLHVGRDFAAVLHQLYLISLHDPPRDGILARPQAAVQDVVAAVHWRRKGTRGLRSLPGSTGWCPRWQRAKPCPGTQSCPNRQAHAWLAPLPGAGSPLPPSHLSKEEKSSRMGSGQPFCTPGFPPASLG